jgi:hypothetical protein
MMKILLSVLISIICLASSQTYETTISRRERNLDHWDAETLAAYLGLDPDTAQPLEDATYVGIDASIMFYAQWCKNCHKFAPVWDTIGQIVHAGTTESNLIMALFNCELDQQHTKLCDAAGVTHYPTLMYVGAGPYQDTDPITSAVAGDKAAGPYGPSKLPRTVKFQGNLNIGDSVLDWIKTMRGLSTWYRWSNMEGGWLKGIRGILKNPFSKKKAEPKGENALPVGIPTGLNVAPASSGKASMTTYALEKELKTSEEKMKSAQKDLDDSTQASTHAGFLIDSFLFPTTTNDTDAEGKAVEVPIDAFTKMNETNAWDVPLDGSSADEQGLILKSCVVDLTLDYCTRFSSKATTDYLDRISDLPNDKYPSFTEMESELLAVIKEIEPYCSDFSSCYENGFKDIEMCRPATCPFKNEAACRYLNGCMSDNIRKEYEDILLENKSSASASVETDATVESGTKPKTWGMK